MLTGRRGRSGQNAVEYAVVIAAVATAMIAMAIYVRRSVQANMKNIEQELNAAVEEEPAPAP